MTEQQAGIRVGESFVPNTTLHATAIARIAKTKSTISACLSRWPSDECEGAIEEIDIQFKMTLPTRPEPFPLAFKEFGRISGSEKRAEGGLQEQGTPLTTTLYLTVRNTAHIRPNVWNPRATLTRTRAAA